MEKGIEKGIEKGSFEEKRKIAINMLKKKMDKDLIKELTGLTDSDIEKLDLIQFFCYNKLGDKNGTT